MPISKFNSIRHLAVVGGVLVFVLSLSLAGCSDKGTSSDDGNGEPTEVSFADDVLPILTANCAGGNCHIPGPEPNTQLSLKDYASVVAGSVNGDIVVAGDADASEIVRRLEGTSVPRMPLGGAPLSAATIATVRDWIDEGAKDN